MVIATMALLITERCINCDMCEPECVGHYDKPTCQSVCPITNTIIIDPEHTETQEMLWDKFVLMYHADKI